MIRLGRSVNIVRVSMISMARLGCRGNSRIRSCDRGTRVSGGADLDSSKRRPYLRSRRRGQLPTGAAWANKENDVTTFQLGAIVMGQLWAARIALLRRDTAANRRLSR